MSLGENIPTSSHHNLLFAMPAWQDNVDYKEGNLRVLDLVRAGYPRFVYHSSMKELCGRLDVHADQLGEHQLVFPGARVAAAFRDFCLEAEPAASLRVVQTELGTGPAETRILLQVVCFPESLSKRAKFFWTHAGFCVSSRMADYCLSLVSGSPRDIAADSLAKEVLRERIADALKSDAGGGNKAPHLRAVAPNDVFLYPSGMAAVWSAHQLALSIHPAAKSVYFGFGYVDTLRVIQNWGPGSHFLGTGDNGDLEALEHLLATVSAEDRSQPPILALFCESPCNPLLRSVDLSRLRALADQYDFLVIIDETVGNFANVDVLPYADIVVTSLTKVFSGVPNVMGGSMALNPNGKHYVALRDHLKTTFEDLFWHEDAAQMELNSRDFAHRAHIINQNAETLADFLHAQCGPNRVLKKVLYPKWVTRELYDLARRPDGGFGGLLNIVFHAERAAQAFFDALQCHKGSSIGTNFTLACPYAIISHYDELEWVAQYGVELASVRMSVGMEPVEVLVEYCRVALAAAEDTLNVEIATNTTRL
ncbi:PLP-dependent transferase [Auricularia subglabra TFB-10046 SS5]|nr:PLP-dependent transferase [Auricularia subglabra TFB-10046 SS5]